MPVSGRRLDDSDYRRGHADGPGDRGEPVMATTFTTSSGRTNDVALPRFRSRDSVYFRDPGGRWRLGTVTETALVDRAWEYVVMSSGNVYCSRLERALLRRRR